MQYERNWPQSSHADRWCADLPVILRLPGRQEQQVHLENFSVAGVRVTGAAGMMEGEHASLDVGDQKAVAVSMIWVSGDSAGCRFLGTPTLKLWKR